jgi:hypothetical protein
VALDDTFLVLVRGPQARARHLEWGMAWPPGGARKKGRPGRQGTAALGRLPPPPNKSPVPVAVPQPESKQSFGIAKQIATLFLDCISNFALIGKEIIHSCFQHQGTAV